MNYMHSQHTLTYYAHQKHPFVEQKEISLISKLLQEFSSKLDAV